MPVGPVWTLGDVTVTSIIEMDQHWRFAWLLPEVTEELIDGVDWLRPDYVDEAGKLILRIQALVVDTPDQRIVVDTCVGNDKERPSPLFDRLDTRFLDDFVAAGFPLDSVDQVACTHLHVDHVGWNTRLVDGAWVPTFPSARYLFGRVEYEHWTTTEETVYGDVLGDSVSPILDAGLATLVESDHVLCPGVRLEPTPGHTPGHHSIRITSDGATAVITGDMIHHPVQLPHPDQASGADSDPVAAIATRRRAFTRWCDESTLVIGTHFAGPGAGRLVAEGDGWRLDPHR